MTNSNYSRVDSRMLQRRVQNMISRGVVSNVDDALQMQLLGVELEDGFKATRVEHVHPYGFSYHPKEGAEVIAFSLGGNRDHLMILPAADRRHRVKDLQPGELAVHDDKGQVVLFKADGLHLTSPTKVVVHCPDINLGGEGGKPVAVEGTVDSAGHPLVSAFATKVKAV